MKTFIYKIGSSLLMLLAFIACEEQGDKLVNTGYLQLGVTRNVEVVTKAADPKDQSLAVDICQTVAGKDSVVKHFSDYNDMAGERVLLNVGTYKVIVSSSNKLDFEKPTFYGEADKIVVKQGETNKASVTCFLNCVKVTTEFTRPVKEKFAVCEATISNEGGKLTYDKEETRAGYFQPGYLLVDLKVANKEGVEFHLSKLIEKVEAKDHYNLIFDLIDSGDNNSGLDFDIKIDTDPTNDEEHTVTIPLPDTGYGQEAPVVKMLGETEELTEDMITVEKGDTKTWKLAASSTNIGLKSVTLLTSSEDFKALGLSSVNLLNLSDGDKSKLSSLQLAIPTLSDKKGAFEVDFTNMVPTLSGGTHSFIFSVRDELGHETVKTMKVVVNLQLNTVAVKESEVWAHYATLRGYIKGATVDDVNSYKFEYKKSTEGENTWKEIEGTVTVLSTSENGGNIKQIVTHLEAGTSYDYRIVQSDTPASSMAFTTEAATPLTNGNFEDDANGPWNISKDKPNSFWSSGNNSQTPKLAASYKDGNNQMAYLVATEAVGKLAAGNAFTGGFELILNWADLLNSGGKVTLGKNFTSRPSSLKGKYKYNPGSINHSGAITLPNGKEINVEGTDKCSIYIVLLTDQIVINTTAPNTLFDLDRYKNQIIAYAELPENMTSENMTDFASFELQLRYYQLDKKPTYIGVLCSTCKYGDYFKGSSSSKLWIDDFELTYDQSPTE